MKRFLIAAALAAAAVTNPALGADVGVSVSIGQPGFYGRLDVGGYPPPQVIYREPRVIEQVPTNRPPVYLRAPPSHVQDWGRHCREYDACGERVYFVQDDWYNREYVPRYQRIGQPDFYGRIDISGYPQPQVIYRQPRVIERVVINRPPIYLRVPQGHARNWRKHCREYNACGERVYFVQDTWYNREYVPRYHEQHRDRRDGRRGDRRDDHRGDHHGDHRNDRYDNDYGRDHDR